MDLGFDFLEKYKKDIAAVTPGRCAGDGEEVPGPEVAGDRGGRPDRQGWEALEGKAEGQEVRGHWAACRTESRTDTVRRT